MSFRDRSASSNLLRASWAAGGVRTEVRGAPTPSMKRGQRVAQTFSQPQGWLWVRTGPRKTLWALPAAGQTPPPCLGSQLMREQGQGSWGPAGSSPAKGDTNNSHPGGGRRAPGTGVVVPASPGPRSPLQVARSPLGLPGPGPGALKEQAGPVSWAPAPAGDREGPSLPGSALTVDEGLCLLIIRWHSVLLGGAGRLGGWDWGWGVLGVGGESQ